MNDKCQTDCLCLTLGPRSPAAIDEQFVGVDKTDGRFADVTLRRCPRCGRLWLRYQVEYEAFTSSGRWAEAPIGDDTAATITPETAAAFLDRAPFHIFGGSFWGHDGRRGRGRLPWGISGSV